jgi:hypothetical protein
MAINATMPPMTAAAPIAESIILKMLIQASFRLVDQRVKNSSQQEFITIFFRIIPSGAEYQSKSFNYMAR